MDTEFDLITYYSERAILYKIKVPTSNIRPARKRNQEFFLRKWQF